MKETRDKPRVSYGQQLTTIWTPEEDRVLVDSVQEGLKWADVARRVAAVCVAVPKSSKQCCQRWLRVLHPDIRKGNWTPAEDAQLLAAIRRHGIHSWKMISTSIPGRTGLQCRSRYYQHHCASPAPLSLSSASSSSLDAYHISRTQTHTHTHPPLTPPSSYLQTHSSTSAEGDAETETDRDAAANRAADAPVDPLPPSSTHLASVRGALVMTLRAEPRPSGPVSVAAVPSMSQYPEHPQSSFGKWSPVVRSSASKAPVHPYLHAPVTSQSGALSRPSAIGRASDVCVQPPHKMSIQWILN